jgi:hypothetical protein
MSETVSHSDSAKGRTWIVAAVAVCAVLALLFLWRSEHAPAPPDDPSMTIAPEDESPMGQALKPFFPTLESLQEGGFSPLPSVERPLPGRPSMPMPICKDIYDHVDLDLDGQRAGQNPITLKAGTTVEVKGVIFASKNLDTRVVIDAGLALVSRADNEPGWGLRWPAHFHMNFGQGRCTFDGRYVVPDAPGEHILVVLSSSSVLGSFNCPFLLAAEYPLIIE